MPFASRHCWASERASPANAGLCSSRGATPTSSACANRSWKASTSSFAAAAAGAARTSLARAAGAGQPQPKDRPPFRSRRRQVPRPAPRPHQCLQLVVQHGVRSKANEQLFEAVAFARRCHSGLAHPDLPHYLADDAAPILMLLRFAAGQRGEPGAQFVPIAFLCGARERCESRYTGVGSRSVCNACNNCSLESAPSGSVPEIS